MKLPQVILFLGIALWGNFCCGQWEGREEILAAVEKTFGDPPGMTRLDPDSRVWANKKTGRVVVDGYVALRAGQLEMFACPVGTKEHESVVAVFSKAQLIHAALLAIGAKPGKPVQWEPQYTPPTGSEIQVMALWKDAEGKKQVTDARQWIHELGTEAGTLDTNFVFAGSGFWKDPDTGKEIYQAESGDLICVSNFSTAMLDVPIESSKVNSGLMFASFTDRIPERGTPVRLVLQLIAAKKGDAEAASNAPSTPLPPSPIARTVAASSTQASPTAIGKEDEAAAEASRKQEAELKELILGEDKPAATDNSQKNDAKREKQ